MKYYDLSQLYESFQIFQNIHVFLIPLDQLISVIILLQKLNSFVQPYEC